MDKPSRIEVILPDGLATMTETAWRTLLDVLISAAEAKWGPEWRSRLDTENQRDATDTHLRGT